MKQILIIKRTNNQSAYNAKESKNKTKICLEVVIKNMWYDLKPSFLACLNDFR